ncbi:SAM-dependent methyltransferase [Bombiscardovia apis]|uniref:SAM-dependent methyltransferase n=1 Tax=Bombiscardovia apis TaxID=2932182 RepID=A0ABM8BCT1_9BIFI|nr:class I SAM-dependent methyltransferase [Bombiscardovia apis]BDR54697.1 SAM-dependent methyltransferase [Bombiscardovia apis]
MTINNDSSNLHDDVADNKANWDDRAKVHAEGGYGDLHVFAQDTSVITPAVQRDLAILQPHLRDRTIAGKSLIHLQCHIGTDTISWQRLGASKVHGVDFSPKSLEYARELARTAQAPITYVEADARYADTALPGEHFDCVVTSVGTITWLPSLEEWGRSIANLLSPGGIFMIRDNHPLLFALDENNLAITGDYLSGTEDSYESDGSYTPGSAGKVAHTRNHNWAHDFQEITSSLLNAGLSIEELGEHSEADWQALPMLDYDASSQVWKMPQGAPRIPLTFSLVARKPLS